MKAKTCFALAIAAGCATVATANPEPTTDFQSMSTANVGHIYYNVGTGEMIRTGGTATRAGDPIWINEIYDQCGTSQWYFTGILNNSTGRNDYFVDWGDIESNTLVDSMTFLYATNVSDPEADGEDGFSLFVTFFDGIDGDVGNITSSIVSHVAWEIGGIPGAGSGGGFAGWFITVDFATTPEDVFEIGDADGIDDSGNGLNSGGLGVDVDSDGKSDFGFGLHFTHPVGVVATSGPGLVVPPEATEPNSLGTVDAFVTFPGTYAGLPGGPWIFWNGNSADPLYGYHCSGTGITPPAYIPWADAYAEFYGTLGGEVDPCPSIADVVDDGVLNFFDVQTFLGWFAVQDQRADLVDDDTWNFFDVQTFLGAFAAGCNP